MPKNLTKISAVKTRRKPPAAKISDITDRISKNRVSVFLGAGISIPFKLPKWNALLVEISKGIDGLDTAAFAEYLNEKGMLRAARLLRAATMFSSSMFEDVRGAVYGGYDRAINDPNINGIIDFCERHGDRLEGVFTYNYEEVFEDQYKKRVPMRPVASCHSRNVIAHPACVNVYHLHGFIPLTGEIPDSELILSEETYNDLYSDGLSWRNRVQIHSFETCVCVFLGLSFDDPNLRRLLDFTRLQNKKQNRRSIRHVAIVRREKSVARQELEELMFNDLGIDALFFDDFAEIAGIIDRL